MKKSNFDLTGFQHDITIIWKWLTVLDHPVYSSCKWRGNNFKVVGALTFLANFLTATESAHYYLTN